jgi:hypothetical protein
MIAKNMGVYCFVFIVASGRNHDTNHCVDDGLTGLISLVRVTITGDIADTTNNNHNHRQHTSDHQHSVDNISQNTSREITH